jgi:hypothetical protein
VKREILSEKFNESCAINKENIPTKYDKLVDTSVHPRYPEKNLNLINSSRIH